VLAQIKNSAQYLSTSQQKQLK